MSARAPLPPAPGVLHAASVWRAPSGELVVLRIGPHAPHSAADTFVLGAARARADAILTTGRILRDEPDLVHEVGPRPDGRPAPQRAVLSSGRALDFAHPFFRGPARALVLTSRAAAARLSVAAERAGLAGVEIVGRDAPSLRDAIDFLRRERGCATVLVEAGPSSALALYDEPVAVDELWLSIFAEPALPVAARGGAFLPAERIAGLFGPPAAEAARDESSGRWLFRLYRRTWGPAR